MSFEGVFRASIRPLSRPPHRETAGLDRSVVRCYLGARLPYAMPLFDRESRKQLRALGSVGTVGIELAISIFVGLFGGRWIDGQLGTAPWFQWSGFAFGLAAGFRALFRTAHKLKTQLDDNSQKEPPENEGL